MKQQLTSKCEIKSSPRRRRSNLLKFVSTNGTFYVSIPYVPSCNFHKNSTQHNFSRRNILHAPEKYNSSGSYSSRQVYVRRRNGVNFSVNPLNHLSQVL